MNTTNKTHLVNSDHKPLVERLKKSLENCGLFWSVQFSLEPRAPEDSWDLFATIPTIYSEKEAQIDFYVIGWLNARTDDERVRNRRPSVLV